MAQDLLFTIEQQTLCVKTMPDFRLLARGDKEAIQPLIHEIFFKLFYEFSSVAAQLLKLSDTNIHHDNSSALFFAV
jgi:hypothetical protein